MKLKDIIVDVKTVWVDFPGKPGFRVQVSNIPRKTLSKLRDKCTNKKFNSRTRQMDESLDDDRFVHEFSKAVIKNWEGLTREYVKELLLVDEEALGDLKEFAYDQENAEVLVANSTEFDSWINEVVFDLDTFRS